MSNRALIEELRLAVKDAETMGHYGVPTKYIVRAADALEAMEWKPIEEATEAQKKRMRGGEFHVRAKHETFGDISSFDAAYGYLRDGNFVDEVGEEFSWAEDGFEFFFFLPPAPEKGGGNDGL